MFYTDAKGRVVRITLNEIESGSNYYLKIFSKNRVCSEYYFLKFLKMNFQILCSVYYFGLSSCHSYIQCSH